MSELGNEPSCHPSPPGTGGGEQPAEDVPEPAQGWSYGPLPATPAPDREPRRWSYGPPPPATPAPDREPRAAQAVPDAGAFGSAGYPDLGEGPPAQVPPFEPSPLPPPPRPPTGWVAKAGAVLLVVVVLAAGILIGHALWRTSSSLRTSPSTTLVPPSSGRPGQSSLAPGSPLNAASLAKRTDPGLVDINVVLGYLAEEGAGTGMVLTAGGEVLTNNHVVEGATSLTVTDVGNGRTYTAKVLGYDRSGDVAVLQLAGAAGLKTVTLGNSSGVVTGEGVVAVGNAYGAGSTPSYAAGRVTALDQSIKAEDQVTGASEQLSGLIETNADIVPGDSGGALVNGAGQVVGMVTATSQSLQFSSPATQGYAIPIEPAATIAAEIEAGRSSSTVHVGPTPLLGVVVEPSPIVTPGAEIIETVIGGPAAQAGLVAGDLITSVDGEAVTSPESLTTSLLRFRPGSSIHVGYVDMSGLQQTATVRLGSGPPQ